MDDSRFEVFRGYICQDLSADEEKEEDDDGDEQDYDDQELDAIAAGALHVQPKKPPYRKVKIRSLENRKTIQVHGNFLSIDPWWEVNVTLRPKESRGTYRGKQGLIREMRCQPSYKIRSDTCLDEGGNYGSVLYQFLTECKLEGETKDYFMNHVRKQVPRNGIVNFETIFGVLKDCETIDDEKIRGLLCMVKPYITNSESGIMVQQAMENPTLFQLLPRLLPDRTVTLLKQCAGGDSTWKLKKLEGALQEKPWVFGFSVALRKETNVVLTEVSADRFNQAGVLQDMERHIQDSLHVYFVLKKKCWSEGHTYLWEKGLKHQLKKCYPTYQVQDWKKVWEFLKGVEAVHRKEKGKWAKIFLYKYWKAEDKIVKSLAKILDRGEQDLSCLKEDWACEDEDGMEKECGTEKEVNEEKEVQDSGVSSGDVDSQPNEGTGKCPKIDPNMNSQASTSDVDSQSNKNAIKCEKMDQNVENIPSISVAVSDDELMQLLEGVDHDLQNESCDSSAPEDEQSTVDGGDMLKSRLDLQEQEERDQEQFKDDPSQQKAARSIRDNPFTIISGKGGCGKTHVVCTVLEEYPSYAVAMAAPTGKAASNLRKRSKTGIEAFTLHQINYQYTSYMKKKREYNEQKKVDDEAKEPKFKFECTEILVVDECSMVPITIFSNVLFALLYQGKLKKLILLGDYRQLPSVEPGNLLSDIYKVFKQYGWSIELTINHRAESALIVQNATEISNQRMPIFDSNKFQMKELPENDGFNNVGFLRGVVQNLYESEESIRDHKRSQFVAFKRADCSLINDWCCPMYSGHPTTDSKGKFVFRTGDKVCPTRNALVSDFTEKEDEASTSVMDVDDNKAETSSSFMTGEQALTQIMNSDENIAAPKIKTKTAPKKTQPDAAEAAEIAFLEQLCTQNPVSPCPGAAKEMNGSLMNKSGEEEKKKEKSEKRICNGEIYFITHVHEVQEGSKKDEQISMTDASEGDPGLIAPLRELKHKANVRHAWARTIHTYQGSESETVIYLLGQSGAQNWQHVYTAITRGKAKVYIIGTKSQLKSAIKRDSRVRNTELKEMLMEEIIPKLKQMQGQNCTMSQMQTRSQTANATQIRGMFGSQVPNSTQFKGVCGNQAFNSTHTRGMVGSQTFNSTHVASVSGSQVPKSTSNLTQVRGPYKSEVGHSTQCKGFQAPYSTHSANVNQTSISASGQVHSTTQYGQSQGGRTFEHFQPKMTSTQIEPSRSSHASAANPKTQCQRARTFEHFKPQMTSTQIEPSNSQYNNHTTTSNFTQWRQKPSCSPVKSFTSVRDLPGSPSNAAGLIHSTPKQSRTSAHNFQQDNDDDNEWSNEWSDERLQQVLDMETTALADSPGKATPPLFEDEMDEAVQPKKLFSLSQPKPLFKSSVENSNVNAKCFRKYEQSSAGPVNSTKNSVFRKFKQDNAGCVSSSSTKDSVQPKCNIDANDKSPPEYGLNSLPGHGFKSPPPNSKHKPHMAVSPFTPNTSGKLLEAWSLKTPARNNAVPKRLYTDMKESPITDGFPHKRQNSADASANDSDLMF